MARQKLGQHFLASGRVLQKIAAAACGSGVGLAVEIGPGRGALTAALLAHAERVVAVELDSHLVQTLRERWPNEPRFEVIQADALRVDFSRFGSGVLAGNLPYYVATAIISRYLRNPGDLSQGVFLVQKEVADRIVACPGSRDYGYLSVQCQFLADAQFLFQVPPGAFQPPPKVDSAAIRLTPHPRSGVVDADKFLDFASACFRQKRKTLRNNLAGRYAREVLATQAQTMDKRAETLSVDEFIRLHNALAEVSDSEP